MTSEVHENRAGWWDTWPALQAHWWKKAKGRSDELRITVILCKWEDSSKKASLEELSFQCYSNHFPSEPLRKWSHFFLGSLSGTLFLQKTNRTRAAWQKPRWGEICAIYAEPDGVEKISALTPKPESQKAARSPDYPSAPQFDWFHLFISGLFSSLYSHCLEFWAQFFFPERL